MSLHGWAISSANYLTELKILWPWPWVGMVELKDSAYLNEGGIWPKFNENPSKHKGDM